MLGGGLGALGGDLGKKNGQEAVLADLGRFGTGAGCQNGGKIAQLGAKMGQSWRQDDPRWGLSGHLGTNWGVIFSILGGLGSDLCRNGRSVKMSTTIAFWLHFRVLGGLVGGSWGYLGASWREVGLSLAILASSLDLVG